MKKFFKNSKGMTLIELLAVIAIIAILFILLIPQIDSAIKKARLTGAQTDLHSYQIGAESYMQETGGDEITNDGLNGYLDKVLRAGTDGTATKKDPWGNAYTITTNKEDTSNVPYIVVKSQGPDKKDNTADDVVSATYYIDGATETCTLGFTNNMTSTEVATCGAAVAK